MARQEFRTADRVRLEVQADDEVTTNRLRNGTPELGTYGWVTPLANMTLSANGNAFRLTSLVAAPALNTGFPGSTRTISAPIPIVAGRWAAASLDVGARLVPGNTAVIIDFYDATGALLPFNGSGAVGSTGRITTPPSQAPAGTVEFRVRVSGSVPAGTGAGWWQEFTRVAAGVGTVAGDVGSVPYTEPYEWRDVLGKTGSIKAVHDGIGLGTLTATLFDRYLDPAVSTALRSGRLVRLTALDAGGVWQSVWRGTMLKGSAVYDLAQTDPDRRSRITISAVNGVAQAANLSRHFGVLTISDLAFLLEGASVPWAVNGSGTQPSGSATYVNFDPEKTLLDQIAVTRDSQRGYAWVDRRGVLNVADAGSRPTALAATLTESDYTALSYDYDTDRCINELTVKALRLAADGTTGEVVFGPYRDQASIDTYGAHSVEVTVQGLADAQIPAYAADVLAANAVPVRKVNSLRFAVRTTADLTVVNGTKRAMLDTYDRVRVTNATGTVDQTLRPTAITHTITAGVKSDKWLVDVEFAADAGAAAPISVPAPPGPSIPAGGDPGPQAGNVVVTTLGNAQAVIAYPRPYPAGTSPVVTCTGGNGESLWVIANPNENGFIVQAHNQAGTPLTNVGIRVFWQATRPTT